MRRGRTSSPTSRSIERDSRGYSKERHSTTSSSNSSSSKRNSRPGSAGMSSPGSTTPRSRRSSEREHSTESDSSRKSRLKPPPLVSPAISTTKSIPTGSADPLLPTETIEEIPSVALDKFELYAAANKYEEDQAREMDTNETVKLLLDYYAELREMIVDVYAARKSCRNETELNELVSSEGLLGAESQLPIILASIRRISRLMKLRLKQAREESVECRQSVDKNHLELQNLIYEAVHLKKEVIAVKDYQSMHEQIDLVPLDQFYKEAPEKISKPHITQKDPHLLRIARLEYEFIQRQRVSQECNDLHKETEKMSGEIEHYKRKMEGVKPILTNILEALEPAQEFYNPGFLATRTMHQMSAFLPPPLYVLFVSSMGYQEFLGKPCFTINIIGDLESAKEIVEPVTDELIFKGSDSEMEVDEPEPELTSRRKVRRHTSFAEERQDLSKKIVETHPLQVEWIIRGENGEILTLKFLYLTKLRIVTVQTELEVKDVSGNVKNLIFERGGKILGQIFPKDDGVQSPNPSTFFYLTLAGMEFHELIPKVGRPYRWAQDLAGLNFPFEDEAEEKHEFDFLPQLNGKPDRTLSLGRIDGTFKKIYRRLKCQAVLWNQLKNLETRTLNVPSKWKDCFPTKNSSVFVSWEGINWESYKGIEATSYPISVDLVSEEGMVFRGAIERGRARVIAAVALTLNYPDESPIFSVQLDDDFGIGQDRVNSGVFREVERELNVFCVEEFGKSCDNILTLQLQRLLYCVDVLLETISDDDSVGPSEFVREKLFENRVKGKGFRRPFKFIPKFGGHFAQRF